MNRAGARRRVGDATTPIALVVAGLLGGITTWWSRRKLRDAGVLAGAEATRNLQLLADTWEERYHLEHGARMSAEQALVDLKVEQKLERVVAAQARADLDDARSEIRALERRRSPRGLRP